MEKKTIEVIIGQKVEGPVDPSLIAPSTPPEGDDAARWEREWIECPQCKNIGYYYRRNCYCHLTCQFCGAILGR